MASVEDIRDARERAMRLLAEIGMARIVVTHLNVEGWSVRYARGQLVPDVEQDTVWGLIRDGFAEVTDGRLVLTAKGRAVMDPDQVTVTVGQLKQLLAEIDRRRVAARADDRALEAAGMGEAVDMFREFLAAEPGQERDGEQL